MYMTYFCANNSKTNARYKKSEIAFANYQVFYHINRAYSFNSAYQTILIITIQQNNTSRAEIGARPRTVGTCSIWISKALI